MLDLTGSLGIPTVLRRSASSRQAGETGIVSSAELALTSSGGGPAFRHSAMSSGSRSDHAGHDHDGHDHSDHDNHAGHDDHAGHDHDDHDGHDHGDHAGHDHGDHAGHDHDDHAGHDHGDHAGHDHDDHAGHDHGDHAGHDHDDHAGHDHGDHAGHDHGDHAGHDHDDHAGHDHDDHDDRDHDDHAGHDHDDHDHDDHAGHDHDDHGHGHHGHAHDLRGASRRSLIVALTLITTYMFAEVVGGILSGSLALIADAGHMLTDAAAIVMALVAMWIADKAASAERTFGYQRAEVLAALINAAGLWLIAGWIVFEAYHRAFREEVHVDGWPVLIVGTGGLLINIAAAWVLHRSSQHSMNVEGAFQHVIADLMGSVGVIISAILILTFEWALADPVLSVAIAVLILFGSRHLMYTVFNVLLEGTPGHIDVYRLCKELEDVEGVTLIHDVHVWTITSGNEAFSAHILIDPAYTGDVGQMQTTMQDLVHNEFGIKHVTIQLERTAAACTEDHHVDHLIAESGQAEKLL